MIKVRIALALAERLSVVRDALVNYRYGNPTSLDNTATQDPMAFSGGLEELGNRLTKAGVMDTHLWAFRNQVANICLGTLRRRVATTSYSATYREVQRLFAKYDVALTRHGSLCCRQHSEPYVAFRFMLPWR